MSESWRLPEILRLHGMTIMTDTRLFREAEARMKRRKAKRNRMADDIRVISVIDRALRDFNLWEPPTKTERFTLSLGWCCLIGCVVFGWVYL